MVLPDIALYWWYHMYCIKSYGIAWYCIVLLLASACGLYLADTYLLCNNLFVGSLFRVWACDFPNLCSGCMMLARDTNIVYFCPPTHTMYCVFVGNTYCTHPSEPWLSTSDGQLWYPCVTSPPPRFPALWGVWELWGGGGTTQVGCLATDWAPATINIITPQVAGNMRSTVATAYRDLKTNIETRQRPSF